MQKHKIILFSVVFIGVFFTVFIVANNVHYKSRQFLNKYGYHIDKKLATRTINLQNMQNESSHGIDLILRATNRINIPLDEYFNQDLKVETYRLKEKSQFDLVNEIDATVLFNSNNEIVGGYLNVWGYLGSLLALDERYFLSPDPKLDPEKLNLANINEITIHAPRGIKTILKDQKEIDRFLKIINKSSVKQEELRTRGIYNIDQYRVWFTYNNGAIIDANIYIHEDFNKIKVTTLQKWTYEPPQELIDFLDSILE